MSNIEIETQAPTVEEAIQKGLQELGVERDKVDVQILDEGSSGLFGLMGAKPAIVRMQLTAGGAPAAGTVRAIDVPIVLLEATLIFLTNAICAAAGTANNAADSASTVNTKK